MEPDGPPNGASRVKALDTIDAATGLLNAHGWLAFAKRHLKRAVYSQQRLGLILLRVHHDLHLAGGPGTDLEAAMHQVAEALSCLVRPGDLLGRWRETDFILLLPYVDAGTIDRIVERLVHGVREKPVRVGGQVLSLLLSGAGSSVIVTRGELHELDALIAEGERRLLAASRP